MQTDTVTDARTEVETAATGDAHEEEVPMVEELLVEEVSIDGMCGVY